MSSSSRPINEKLKLIRKMYHQGCHLEKQEIEEKNHDDQYGNQQDSPKKSSRSHHSSKHHHLSEVSSPKSSMHTQENQKITKRGHMHHHYIPPVSTPVSPIRTQENQPVRKKHRIRQSKTLTNEGNSLFINTGMQTKDSYIQASTPVSKTRIRHKIDDDSIEAAVRNLLLTQPPKTDLRRHHIPSAFQKTDSPKENYLSPNRPSFQKVHQTSNESPYDIYKVNLDEDWQTSHRIVSKKTQHGPNSSSRQTKSSFSSSTNSPKRNQHDDNFQNFVVFDIQPSNPNSPINSPIDSNSKKKRPPPPIQVPGDNQYTMIKHKVNNSEVLSEDSWEQIAENQPPTANTSLSILSYGKNQNSSNQNQHQSLTPQGKKKQEKLPKLQKQQPTKVLDLFQDDTTYDSFAETLNKIEKEENQLAKKEEQDFNQLLEDAEETAKNDIKEEEINEKKQIENEIISIIQNDSNENNKEKDQELIQKIQTTIHQVSSTETSQKTSVTIECKDNISIEFKEEEEEMDENENKQNLLSVSSSKGEEDDDDEEEESKSQLKQNKNEFEFEIEEEEEEKQEVQPSWVIDEDMNQSQQESKDEIKGDFVDSNQIEIEIDDGTNIDESNGIEKVDDAEFKLEDDVNDDEESSNEKVDLNQSASSAKQSSQEIINDQNEEETNFEQNKSSLSTANDSLNQSNQENKIQSPNQIQIQDDFEFDDQNEDDQPNLNINGEFKDDFEEEEEEETNFEQNKSSLSTTNDSLNQSNQENKIQSPNQIQIQDDFEFDDENEEGSSNNNNAQSLESSSNKNKSGIDLSPEFEVTAGQNQNQSLISSTTTTTIITTTTTNVTETSTNDQQFNEQPNWVIDDENKKDQNDNDDDDDEDFQITINDEDEEEEDQKEKIESENQLSNQIDSSEKVEDPLNHEHASMNQNDIDVINDEEENLFDDFEGEGGKEEEEQFILDDQNINDNELDVDDDQTFQEKVEVVQNQDSTSQNVDPSWIVADGEGEEEDRDDDDGVMQVLTIDGMNEEEEEEANESELKFLPPKNESSDTFKKYTESLGSDEEPPRDYFEHYSQNRTNIDQINPNSET